jgi:hypothetical protein
VPIKRTDERFAFITRICEIVDERLEADEREEA